MSGMVPFKFEEFYRAFGKSVSSDVVFADGEIHIVQHKASSSLNDINSRNNRAALEPAELPATSDPLKQHAKGRLLDSADRRRLPWAIRALLDIQEADGSWVFSNKFEFVINGVAPPPINGVASKLWATAVVITVWRQFPEYFELLETHYEKAMLHADENVLRIVRSVLQFDSLDKIRAYEDNEARAIREQLAREAAAKLELELEEEEKIARLREEEIRIGKLSLVHARRLPMPTQKLLVAGLGDELDGVLSRSAATKAKSQPTGSSTTFQVGQLVESRRRRRSRGSAVTISIAGPRWHRCRIIAIDEKCRSLQLAYLDGDCERERRVPFKFVRATAEGSQEIRSAHFAALTNSWSQPILCEAEINRLEEARTVKLKPAAWDPRHHLALQNLRRDGDEAPAGSQDTSIQNEDAPSAVSQRSSRRSRASTARRPPSRQESEGSNGQLDGLFQAAAAALVHYDRAYARVREAARTGAQRYAAASLYRERFLAFDELAESLVTLAERSVDALEAIWRWKQCAVENASTTAFIWKGDDFVLTFVRSLDFLGDCRELVEWYGEEFPLDANPFMLSLSLLDKAADRGLRLSQQYTTARTNPLRLALRQHRCAADDEQSSPPTWWPETRYSSELRHRIEQSEQELFRELVLAHWLEVQGGGRTRGGPITIVGAQPRDVAKQTVA